MKSAVLCLMLGGAVLAAQDWQPVIAELRDNNSGRKIDALRRLNAAGYGAAAEFVAPLVTDPDDNVQFAAIDAELEALIRADPDLAGRFAILASIPGVGATTAFAILVEMPELGSLEQGQAASLAGLAPVARDSGQWNGKRSIRGGRGALRHALYMPALVATRFNPDLKAKYQALIAAGKPPKVAITAVMRKLLLLANALLRDKRPWTPRMA